VRATCLPSIDCWKGWIDGAFDSTCACTTPGWIRTRNARQAACRASHETFWPVESDWSSHGAKVDVYPSHSCWPAGMLGPVWTRRGWSIFIAWRWRPRRQG